METLKTEGRRASDSIVVIPAFNEEPTVGKVVSDALEVCRHVVVVDDGSIDGTADLAECAGAKVIRSQVNCGQGAALRLGFDYALEAGFQLICTLDADGAHDPLELPDLLRVHLRSNADLTIGSRFLAPNDRLVPTPKASANRFATSLLNRLLGTTLTDVASGMRVLSSKAVQLDVGGADFSFCFELIAKARKERITIREGSVSVRYDAENVFSTQTMELVHFLDFSYRNATGALRQAIGSVLNKVELGERVRVLISGLYFILVPLPEAEAFVFQEQNRWHREVRGKADEWIQLQ